VRGSRTPVRHIQRQCFYKGISYMMKVPMRRGHTAEEAATHITVSPRRFFELVAEGAIPRAKRRGYDLRVVRHAYLAHLRRGMAEQDEAAESSLVGARAALTRAVREGVAIKNAANRGGYVPRDMMSKQLAATFVELSKRALAICRIAPAIEIKPRAEVETALRTEVIMALNEMCDPTRGGH
jgi:hypothetical protein